jgi:hypothetical protein
MSVGNVIAGAATPSRWAGAEGPGARFHNAMAEARYAQAARLLRRWIAARRSRQDAHARSARTTASAPGS